MTANCCATRLRRTRRCQKALLDLILQRRAAANVKDGYEFQQELIGHIRETEEARNDFSNALKQMEDGKSPQPTAPERQSGRVSMQPPSHVQPGPWTPMQAGYRSWRQMQAAVVGSAQ